LTAVTTTRPRRALALLATLLAAVPLAACRDDDADDAAPATDPTPVTEAAADTAADTASAEPARSGDPVGAFPVTVEHALGATTIEAEPQRVVTVGVTEQDTVLAVGVVPVGVTEWYGDQPHATWPWAQDELGDAQPEVLSSADGLEFERIAALDPDLIVGTNAGLDEVAYETLSAIAPTIAHPVGAPLYFSPWDDQARLIGAALGRADRMEQVIAEIDAAFAAARAEHPEFAGVSAVFLQNAIYDGSAIAYQEGLSTDFLTDLGFAIPAVLDDFATEGQAYIPLEQLSVLDDADVLLWATEGPGDREALEAEPLVGALRAMQGGQVVYTDGITAGAIYFTSPLSLPFVLDHLVPALASTLAGGGPAQIDAGATGG
jgi:iron complex transport system substrate-binding protein